MSILEKKDSCYISVDGKTRHITTIGLIGLVLIGFGFVSGWYIGDYFHTDPPRITHVDFFVDAGDVSLIIYDNPTDHNLLVSGNSVDFTLIGFRVYGITYDHAYLDFLQSQGFTSDDQVEDYLNTTDSDFLFNIEYFLVSVGSWKGFSTSLNRSDADPLDLQTFSFLVENRSLVITDFEVYIVNVTSGLLVDISAFEIFTLPSINELSHDNATGLWHDGEHTIGFDRFTYYEDTHEIGQARITIDDVTTTKNCTSVI